MQRVLLALLVVLAGCRSAPEPTDMKPEEAFQAIANTLPRADFGWGSPSGLAELAASSRGDRPNDAPIEIACDERGMKVIVEVFRPKQFTISYSSIAEVTYEYELFPNLLFCVLFPFLQVSEARIVFTPDHQFYDHVYAECDRLEGISREVGMGGPWEHAQSVRRKLADDAREFGEGKVSLHFSYVVPVPPWFPYTAPARRAAEAFAWARTHCNEPRR